MFASCTVLLTMVPVGVPSFGKPVQVEAGKPGKPSRASAPPPASTSSVNGFQMSSMPARTRTPALVATVA
jgi:hypothetical protein